MTQLHFQLVTPEKTVLEKELVSLTCPTPMGQITILPNHAKLVSSLVVGELHARTQNDDFFIHVSGGFIEVKEDNRVVVLADAAEHHYEIDQKRAEEAKARAELARKEIKVSSREYSQVTAALERSLSRINIARKRSKHNANKSYQENINN